jgi:hypothetical protein
MYAYADESGQTGGNLLDPAQPAYYAAAVLSVSDLDTKYGPAFSAYAKQHGFEFLHASEMGMGRLSGFLPTLAKWIKRDTIRFFIGTIDKRWFILCKLFDFLFDPVENRGARGHVYLIRQLRYLMLVKLWFIVEEADLRDIWDAIRGRNLGTSQALLLSVLQRLRNRLDRLPDQRSREIIRDTFMWADRFPEELGLSFKGKRQLLGNYPNVAMFTPLMLAIEKQSKKWGSPVKRITHDRQSQFQAAWREMHEILGNASDKPMHLIGGPEVTFRAAPGSSFVIGDSSASAGIQLADCVLWLVQRTIAGDSLTQEASAFMVRVMRNTEHYEMSYDSTVATLQQELVPVMTMDMPADKLERGVEIVRKFEERRLEAMLELEEEKVKKGTA